MALQSAPGNEPAPLATDAPRIATTRTLRVAYLELGAPAGRPVVLAHGWPSDVQDWAEVARTLALRGFRVIVPWLRGCGPTQFLDADHSRSGQQAALGVDLKELIEALGLARPILAGYDWGGRAACIVAALWPDLVGGLVSIGGYNIQDLQGNREPQEPEQEWRLWYQWYMNTARGLLGLERNRRALAQHLWRLWSPNWSFGAATFERTAQSFDNPDWVRVTAHSYRHRHGNADGDPAYAEVEAALQGRPPITVPAVVLHGACDGVDPPTPAAFTRGLFGATYERHVIPVAGHFLSREAPDAVVDAIVALA